MARARNKATEANENTAADEAAEMAALEAALNGEGDAELEIDDADFVAGLEAFRERGGRLRGPQRRGRG